jgi:hypothetical protein
MIGVASPYGSDELLLSIQVWLVLAFVIPLSGLFLWILSKYSPFYSKDKTASGLAILDNAIFYTFGAFFTQGEPFGRSICFGDAAEILSMQWQNII